MIQMRALHVSIGFCTGGSAAMHMPWVAAAGWAMCMLA
jgi:hypothetical protein